MGPGRTSCRAARARSPTSALGIPRAVSVVPSSGSTAMSTCGRRAVADPLAVEQHRRLVLLALADHDDAVHVNAVEHVPHRVDGRLVGGLLVARGRSAALRRVPPPRSRVPARGPGCGPAWARWRPRSRGPAYMQTRLQQRGAAWLIASAPWPRSDADRRRRGRHEGVGRDDAGRRALGGRCSRPPTARAASALDRADPSPQVDARSPAASSPPAVGFGIPSVVEFATGSRPLQHEHPARRRAAARRARASSSAYRCSSTTTRRWPRSPRRTTRAPSSPRAAW